MAQPQQVPQEIPHRACNAYKEELKDTIIDGTDTKYKVTDWCPGCLRFNHNCMILSHPSAPAGKSIK